MSLFSDDADHFVRWNRARARYITAGDFVPRSLYGAYLDDTLEALAAGVPRATFCALTGVEATDIEPLEHGFAVKLGDSATLPADEVVLATGHPLPADPLARWLPREAQRYVRDPWCAEHLDSIGRDERVLLLGTGLTMVDVALTLACRGHAGISRPCRGAALHRACMARPTNRCPPTSPRNCGAAYRSATCAARYAQSAQRLSGDGARPALAVRHRRAARQPELFWGALCAADRRRFVQRLRPYWDVHRHRLPPATAAR